MTVLLSQGGCGGAPGARPDSIDLSGLFKLESGAPDRAAEDSFRRDVPVERAGQERTSLVLIAPVTVSAHLPAMTGAVRLTTMTAPVFNIGDGFEFEVALLRPAGREVLCRRYYDPGRIAADREWVPLSVEFQADGAGDLDLELRLDGGPQGDLITDWLAVASPRLSSDRRSK